MVIEPERTLEPEGTNADAMLDDPPPQDHDFVVEQVEVDATGHADKPTSPVRTDDKPSSQAKATDKSSTPVKAVGDKEDDIMIIGVGHTIPGNHVALSKHSAKEELSGQRQVEHRPVQLRSSQRPRTSFWFFKPSVHKP